MWGVARIMRTHKAKLIVDSRGKMAVSTGVSSAKEIAYPAPLVASGVVAVVDDVEEVGNNGPMVPGPSSTWTGALRGNAFHICPY